jgi:sortase B
MPEFDRRPAKRRRRRRKENIAVSILRGLFPWRGDGTGDIVRKFILIASLGLIVWAGIQIIEHEVWNPARTDREREELIGLRNNYEGEEFTHVYLPRFQSSDLTTDAITVIGEYWEFYERNDDFVGWVEIYPIIQYPVYQYAYFNDYGIWTGDNEFYLNHDHDRNPTTNGTIFSDWEGRFTPFERPHTTIIYGHNLQTKNLFQPLLNYRPNNTSAVDSFEFLKKNPTIIFDTLYERGNYKIFGVMQVNVWRDQGEVFDFWNHVYFRNKTHFDNFIAGILDRSMYYTNVDIEYGDEILLLSTCDFSMLHNGADSSIRLVVAARRVRDNEFALFTEAEIDAFIDNRGNNAERQSNRRMFDTYYTMRGIDGWAGRNWDLNYIKDFEG